MSKKRPPIKIIVTAGPTREYIDPVRFISNESTGRMGYAIAEKASRRGHRVTLISGAVHLPRPRVARFIDIKTVKELFAALRREIKRNDCLIMCAAVGDFRPERASRTKIKRKRSFTLRLVSNPDLLKELSRHKGDKVFVGFSLETEAPEKMAWRKLSEKRLDILVANRLSKYHNPFGMNKLDVIILDRQGGVCKIYNKYKGYIADVLLDKIEEIWYQKMKPTRSLPSGEKQHASVAGRNIKRP